VSRARRAVRQERVRFEPNPATRASVANAFASACVDGDVGALLSVLAEDVVMRADGGGTARAARKPLRGSSRVAHAILALRRVAMRADGADAATVRIVPMNGTPGMLISERGEPSSLMGVDVADGRVVAIHVVREPHKLAAALATLE